MGCCGQDKSSLEEKLTYSTLHSSTNIVSQNSPYPRNAIHDVVSATLRASVPIGQSTTKKPHAKTTNPNNPHRL